MPLPTFLLVLLGAAAAGFTSGLSGFAFGLVGLSIWAWLLEPQLLAPIVVAGSLASQLVSYFGLRQTIDWRRVAPFLIGGAVGVPFGTLALGHIDLRWFRGVTGALMIVYCGGMLLVANLPPIRHGGRLADGIAGMIGGIMGGLAGLTGPVPTLWCNLRRWDKDAQRAVFQTFNLVMHFLTLSSYAVTGHLTREFAALFAWMLPAILLATLVGNRLYTRLSEAAFRRMVLMLLLVSGCVLVWGSLR